MTAWQPHATFGGVIDVSHHNGVINWDLVPAGYPLVMIKASQGAAGRDPAFQANTEGARRTNRMVIPYHFLTEDPVDRQLANFVAAGGLLAGTAAMIDWEVDPSVNRRPATQTMEAFGTLLAARTQRPPLAYHGMFDLSSPAVNAWPWEVPKYGPQPQGPRWLFWQDRPNLAVPGIPNPTDHALFAGTADDLREWWRTGKMPAGFDASPTPPQPVPTTSDVPGAIRGLQGALQLAGLYAGALDGIWGPASEHAVEKFRAP